MIDTAIPTLVLIGLAAVLAPIVAEWSRRIIAIPEVVIQIIFGILLGPYVLNLAHPNNIVTALSDFGLTYLMFLAGTELDLSTMRQGHLGRSAGSWLASLVLALAVGEVLHATGLVLDHTVVALCLTTTALGTLLPILHDNGVLRTPLGPSILSVGAIGEFGPIVAVAVLLTNRDAKVTFLLLALFVALAVIAALLATMVHPPRFIALMRKHLDSTAQLPVRISVLLVVLLVYLADKLSLDVLLGAFAAGVVVRLFIKGEDSAPITSKLEAIGFGFLIPIFFIATGVQFDLKALFGNATAIAEVPLFLLALLRVRGLPALLYRNLVGRRRAAVAGLMQATTLTFVIVATQIGLVSGKISPTTSASLLTAGLLSAALFPAAALRLLAPGGPAPEPVHLEETG